jgi:hypothetical protein
MLQNAKKLHNATDGRSKVYINPHLTRMQSEAEKVLREELKQRKDAGDDVVIKNGKVVLRND